MIQSPVSRLLCVQENISVVFPTVRIVSRSVLADLQCLTALFCLVVCPIDTCLRLSELLETRVDMQQSKGSTFGSTVIGGHINVERPHTFSYGWKRLARTSGMQQHTEKRSVRRCSKLSVLPRAVLERPPSSSFGRHRPASKPVSKTHRQHALLQESLLESAPSQTNTEGRSTLPLCGSWQHLLLTIFVQYGCRALILACSSPSWHN